MQSHSKKPRCAVSLEPEGWILRNMAEQVMEHATRIEPVAFDCRETAPDADCIYYPAWPHYYLQPAEVRKRPMVAMTTHIDRFAFRVARMARGKQVRLLYMARRYRNLLRWYGIASKKMMPGRLGFDPEAFTFSEEPPVRRDNICLGVVGRLYPDGRKGEKRLMRIAELLDPSTVEFLIVGDRWEEWIRTAEALGHRVQYHARVEAGEIPALYRKMDALMIPSSCEGGPVTALEALSSGTPLISRDVGYVNELLNELPDGGSLFTTPKSAAAAVARAREMKAALRGQRNRVRDVLAAYTWQAYVRQVEDAVLDVVSRGGS